MGGDWEGFFDSCMRELAREELVVDIGGGHPFQKHLQKYKGMFTGKFYSLDYSSFYRPSMVGDIHKLPFKDNQLDAVICKSVLEHVPNPVLAMDEIGRVVKKGGKAYVYVPYIYPYHAAQEYKDFYRFSEDAVRYLFRNFSQVKVVKERGVISTLFYFLPYSLSQLLFPITNLIDKVFFSRSRNTSGLHVFAVK